MRRRDIQLPASGVDTKGKTAYLGEPTHSTTYPGVEPDSGFGSAGGATEPTTLHVHVAKHRLTHEARKRRLVTPHMWLTLISSRS